MGMFRFWSKSKSAFSERSERILGSVAAQAAIGLEKLSEPCKVRVLTDSRYVVQTMQGNFRKKTNLEWWARIDRAAQKHQITWEWVKGHAGHDVQEVVDDLARKTAELGKVDEAMFDELIADIGVKEI